MLDYTWDENHQKNSIADQIMRKKGIPGLERIRAKRENAKKPHFFARHWQYLTSLAVALGWMLTNSTAVMTNLREFPDLANDLKNQVLAWYYADQEWTGAWSDDVEGIIGENPLTGTLAQIRLSAEHGEIGGEISTKQLCARFPFYNFVMLEGSLSFGKFRGVGWDYISGERITLFSFKMRRVGNSIMEISPIMDPYHLLPEKMVLARLATENYPAGMTVSTDQKEYCKEEKKSASDRLFRPNTSPGR